MDHGAEKKAVYIGYGESEDPLPEKPQLTRYRVFAGPCKDCGCSGRKLFPSADVLVIICDQCRSELKTTIPVAEVAEVTYVYWCNSSRFASDEVELSSGDKEIIAALEKQFPIDYEVPRWAVTVIGGRCSNSELCVNVACPYLKKSQ